MADGILVAFSCRQPSMEVPMAVGVQIDVVSGTLAQYDEVVERMGYLPGGLPAPNVLFH